MTACTINLNDLYGSLNNPFAEGFLNPIYVEPDDVGSGWSIKIFIGDTAYQFNYFYASETMELTSTFGERGTAKFVIHDNDPEGTILPFTPTEELSIEIWNVGEDYLYFRGFIREVDADLLEVRTDLTEAANYTITCTDLFHELERNPITKLYENKKLGFIARDIITRYTTLDASDIDSQLGFTVESYPISAKMPSQVLQHIMELTNTTYIIDPLTRKIQLTTKDSAEVRFPVSITDTNVYDYFDRDTFKLRRQTDTIKNQIEFWFTEKYSKGTVNVSNGSNIVVGYGGVPETEWDDLPAGLEFKLAASDAVYTVDKNNSAGLTQELRLSSAFGEANASDQAYELRGNRRRVYVSDETSIGLMRTLRGDSGIFTHVVSEDNNFFTFAEARRFASALLSLSQPLPKGSGDTYTSAWGFQPLRAGMVLPVNLPQSKRFVGDIVVNKLIIKDEGGLVDPEDNPFGQTHPYCKIRFDFSATFTQAQAALRKMMQDARKVKVNLEEIQIEDYRRVQDTLVVKECLHPSTPTNITDYLTLSDAIQTRVESAGPLFYYEQDFYLNDIDYAFYSD